MPQQWPTPPEPASLEIELQPPRLLLEHYLGTLPPEVQLPEDRTAELRAELAKVADLLPEARKLAELRRGRHAVTYAPDFISTLMPHLDDTRAVARLLHCDAILRAQDHDIDGAFLSGRAVLNTGRSLHDEPGNISQLVRLACQAIAIRSWERTLAQGQPSDGELAPAQEVLELEATVNIVLLMFRGERASMHGLMEALENGQVKVSQLLAAPGGAPGPAILDYVGAMTYKSNHAWILRYMNEMVELAKLPPEQREPRIQLQEATLRAGAPLIARLVLPATSKLADAAQRNLALAHCAVVAIAAERYRRRHSAWPPAPGALVTANFLTEVPTDPYDGQPLRYRVLPDGLVIYAVGPDGLDNQGVMNRQNYQEKNTDLGFRLWNTNQRRQPPFELLPLPKEDDPLAPLDDQPAGDKP
jgi:hypothetical protein